jgi:hypothetical protein
MSTTREQIAALIKQANSLLVSVGNEPLEIPLEPTYRTPTIRDLINGPIDCEYSYEGEPWAAGSLVAIDAGGTESGFYVEEYDSTRVWHRHCRIPAEPELPPEQPEWELIDGVLFKGEWRVELFQRPDADVCILVSGPKGDIGFDVLKQAIGYVDNWEARQ